MLHRTTHRCRNYLACVPFTPSFSSLQLLFYLEETQYEEKEKAREERWFFVLGCACVNSSVRVSVREGFVCFDE